jgi:ACT domain-containing protein
MVTQKKKVNAVSKGKERAPEHVSKERAVITVNGIDHPGIIAEITRALADLDVNIEDLSQTIVQGLFTMILIADITDHDLARLQQKMAAVGKQQGVQITVQHENIFKYMHRV